jgi:hypothetical protein
MMHDVQSDKIAAPLVQHQSRTNIIQNGYKQQACVYIISQHKNRPPYKIGMDNGGFARQMANYRTILRHLYVYYAMGFPREGYNQSSYARAAENFLHWRKYRLQFSSFSASTQQWDQGGGNYTELCYPRHREVYRRTPNQSQRGFYLLKEGKAKQGDTAGGRGGRAPVGASRHGPHRGGDRIY